VTKPGALNSHIVGGVANDEDLPEHNQLVDAGPGHKNGIPIGNGHGGHVIQIGNQYQYGTHELYGTRDLNE